MSPLEEARALIEIARRIISERSAAYSGFSHADLLDICKALDTVVYDLRSFDAEET